MIDFLCNTTDAPIGFCQRMSQLVNAVIMGEKIPVDNYDWWTIGISILALVVSVLAFISQEKVARNTKQLNLKSQYKIMIDMVRHLYRNFVVMWAIANKMRVSKYKIYPAEIHLQKAKVPMDIIHLELFAGRSEKVYDELYKLELQLRNYNLELDAAMKHFEQAGLKQEVKEYDINTLLFKPGFLANKIVEVLSIAYGKKFLFYFKPKKIKKEARKIIEKCSEENVNKFGECKRWDKENEFEPFEKWIRDKNVGTDDDFFLKIFDKDKEKFFKMLNEDAKIECGKNTEGEDKLLFIEL